jgi:hypothetical protein
MANALDFGRHSCALHKAALECGKWLLDASYSEEDIAAYLYEQIGVVLQELKVRPDTLPPAGATPQVPLPPAPRPETGSVTARTGANISFEDRLKTVRA